MKVKLKFSLGTSESETDERYLFISEIKSMIALDAEAPKVSAGKERAQRKPLFLFPHADETVAIPADRKLSMAAFLARLVESHVLKKRDPPKLILTAAIA